MFDHLDDPDGFTPDDRFRAGARAQGRARRRRRLLARTGLASVAAVTVVAGLAVAAVDRRLDRVDRVEVASLAPEPEADADPFTVLFVGVDGAAGLAVDDPVRPGRVGIDPASSRSDTMVLVRVQPADDTLTVLPLPRDLLVDVPGRGPGRLNSVLVEGGPGLLTETVQAELGIDVNRYVQLDLQGAIAIGDALGGLRLSFDAPVRDPSTGLVLDAGCHALDGRQLLALGRSRRLEQGLPDGGWRTDPTADLGRIERQQAIGVAALTAVSQLDATDPGQLAALLEVAMRNLTVDSATTNAELLDLVRAIAGSTVVQLRLPVVGAVYDGASVLEAGPGVDGVLDAFGTTGTTGTDPEPDPGSTTPPGSAVGSALVPVAC